MYKIENTLYGFKLTFGDTMNAAEMKKWYDESRTTLDKKILSTKRLDNIAGAFGVYVDMRSLKPLDSDAQKLMVEGQKLYQRSGLKRSAVILNDTILTMQFRRLARESGISSYERYIDASKTPDHEKQGLDWILKGVDPYKLK